LKYRLILSLILTLLLLCGCGQKEAAAPAATAIPAPTAAPTAVPAPTETPTATPAPTEVPTATPAPTPVPTATPAPTEVPTATPAPANSYTLSLTADTAIYQGPDPDFGFAQTVGVDGVYTIVEECWDEFGDLWGYLKSGAGWVNLSQIRAGRTEEFPIAASFTSEALMNAGNYEYFIVHESTYSVNVLIDPLERVWDLELAAVNSDSGQAVPGETLGSFHRLEPGRPLVLKLEFPGDMSAYAITLTDGAYRRTFALTLSGRDGSPWLWEIAE